VAWVFFYLFLCNRVANAKNRDYFCNGVAFASLLNFLSPSFMSLFPIAQQEYIQAVRDKRIRFFAFFLFILLSSALSFSYFYYQQENRDYQQAAKSVRLHWENQALKNPHSAAHFGTYVFKPFSSLSLFDSGLEKYLGRSIFLEAHQQNLAQYQTIADQNDLGRFAELTLAFILVYLLPLFIILMAFSSFSSEYEQGRLKLLCSQGCSVSALAWGKFWGITALVLTLLLPLSILGAIFMVFSGSTNDDFLRYGLLLLILLGYYLIFIQISILLSALTKKGHLSLVLLLGIWLFSAFLAPRLLANLSKTLYPAPTALAYQEELQRALNKGVDGHNPFSERSKAFEDSVLKAHGVDSVHKLPFNYAGLIMQAGEEHETVVYEKALQKLNQIYLKQVELYQVFSFLSPTILVRLLSMQICKSDLEAHFHFSQQAERYRIDLVRELNYDLKDNAKAGDWEYKPQNPDFFKQTVAFSYQSPTLSDSWSLLQKGLLYLFVWVCISSILLGFITSKLSIV
jgi:ABC-2 type transport system permease protein